MSSSSLLRCPLCRSPFAESDGPLVCPAGHSFDRARQGYYNLLPVQRKRSRAPGDSPEMVQARRAFLERGWYRPISDALNQDLATHLTTNTPQLLDSGCGEGYYTARLEQALSDKHCHPTLFGLDISKPAVRAACQRSRSIHWLVASAADIPLQSAGLDAIVCLFSHLVSSEYHRLLKADGQLWVATTGPDHLIELRERIYPQVRRQSFDPLTQLQGSFERTGRQQLRFPLTLESSEAIRQLLAMTPHQWRASAEARQAIATLERLDLTADIELHRFRPLPAPHSRQP